MSVFRRATVLTGLISVVGGAPRMLLAQAERSALTITAATSLDAFRDRRAPIEFTLSRVLTPDEGELVVLVGSHDVSSMVTLRSTRATLEPGLFPLPVGESPLQLQLYTNGQWITVSTFTLRVRGAGGFARSSASPTITLNSTGLVADGQRGDDAVPAGAKRQDATLAAGFRSANERPGFAIETQSSLVGATREEQALRFAQRGTQAPQVDLSDYRVSLRMPQGRVELGHVSLGSNRHLIAGMTSRGVALTTGPSWASLTLGSVAGAPIVGWDNLIGLAESAHRVSAASLGVELLRQRPGALQVRVTTMDGSLLPRAGFTQGAVTDAEESRGSGVEITTSTPGQRARLSAGYARSAFNNPLTDTELTGGLTVVRTERVRRGARYLESAFNALNNTMLFARVPTRLTVGWRHERVDPLYRSVGSFVQADRQQDVIDVNGGLGAIALQGGHTIARDNLANVIGVLTSQTRATTANIALPLAAVLRVQRRAAWLPQLTVGLVFSSQYAESAAQDFRPEDLTDQRSRSIESGAQWQLDVWRVSLRDNHTYQDNRQVGRERSDFSGTVQALSLGRSIGSRLDGSLDASLERQRNEELAQVNTVRRVGLSGNWRATNSTVLSSNVTAAVSRTPPSLSDVTNIEMRAELTHTVRLFRVGTDMRTGQFFLRFARTSVTAVPFGFVENSALPLGLATRIQWTVNSGLSLRLW